jgi:alkylation response protein AidB-like acyl-CoA dehydrogenase
MKQAGLFRLWIPRVYGGEESDPEDFIRIVEAVSRIDGSAGWCVMIGGCYGLFAGLLLADAARTIYGSDPLMVSGPSALSARRSSSMALSRDRPLAARKWLPSLHMAGGRLSGL